MHTDDRETDAEIMRRIDDAKAALTPWWLASGVIRADTTLEQDVQKAERDVGCR